MAPLVKVLALLITFKPDLNDLLSNLHILLFWLTHLSVKLLTIIP